MSDYNVADKSVGDQFTAIEHNQLKQSVNSKLDKDKIVQDMSNPAIGESLSTQGLQDYIDFLKVMHFKGNLAGSEAILTHSSFEVTGFWVGLLNFNAAPGGTLNTNYPVNEPGVLRVSPGKEYILYEYFTLINNHRIFICSKPVGGTASAWQEMVNVNYLTTNNYCRCSALIAPSTSVTGISGSYTFTRDDSSNWSRGVGTIEKTEGQFTTEDIVTLTFDWDEDPLISDRNVLVNQMVDKTCDLIVESKTDSQVVIKAFNFIADERVGNSLSFSFNIQ